MDKDKELEEVLNFKFSDFFHWNNARKNPDCPHVLEACWSHVVNNSEMCEDLLFSTMISMHNDAFLNDRELNWEYIERRCEEEGLAPGKLSEILKEEASNGD